MKGFCIPKHIADDMKAAVAAGEFSMESLYEMSSAQRREFFEKWVDSETAKGINIGFEKALLSSQSNALEKWVKKLFAENKTPESKRSDILGRIKDLDDIGVLNVNDNSADSFLADLVEETLGASVSVEEAAKLAKLSRELEELSQKPLDELGQLPEAYWRKRQEIDKYIKSLVPASQLKVATSTIGRGTMLFSLKSPITNVIGNSVMAIQESLSRRIASGRMTGANNDLVMAYSKRASSIYAKTGFDITRVMTLDATQKVLGEEITHAQGKGAVRKVGRFYEDLVFKGLMGAPDVAFSATAFADSANLISTKIAKSEGLRGGALKARAKAIMVDAMKIEPETDLGLKVREMSVADAEYATFQNDSTYSKFGLGIRNVFNGVSGDLRLGDQLMPFVKTPANVVGVAVESTGFGLLAGGIQLIQARNQVMGGDPVAAQKAIRRMVRSGLGLTLAYVLMQALKPDDFYGALPINQKERQLMYEQNASPNTVRIGGKWVSLDYFGNIGSALTGMMYAKKYGSDLPSMAVAYLEGTKSIIAQLPGIEEFSGVAEALTKQKDWKELTPEDYIKGITDYSIDFVRARTIPAFVNDIAKSSDEYERDTTKAMKEGDAFAKLKASIPFVRESLPIRRKLFQDKETGEGAKVLLFGSRVKKAERDRITDEYKVLSASNNMPTISDIEKRSAVINLKSQIGEKEFEKAKEYFGKEWYRLSIETLDSDEYKSLTSDEEKKDLLNKQRDAAINAMLVEYEYVDPETGIAMRPKRPSRLKRPNRPSR